MKCVADQNIPLLKQITQRFSQCIQKPGSAIEANDLIDADVLLVRSVTPVNADLLSKAQQLKFVGSATAGTDHIDKTLLEKRGISFYNAKGCNASTVVDYVQSALLLLQTRQQCCIKGKSLGIIGVGEVGSRLMRRLAKHQVQIVCCDPPRLQRDPDFKSATLDECLACDIVSFHVPLTFDGVDKTYHLLDADKIEKLGAHQVLINTSRGKVWDNDAILQRQRGPKALTWVMDVWEHEPVVSPVLMEHIAIATPHIAGYTTQSKITGAVMVYQALARFFKWHVPLNAGSSVTENLKRHTPLHLAHQDFLFRQQYHQASDFEQLRLNSLTTDFPLPTA